MQIRIQLITLMQMRILIQLITLMLIRIPAHPDPNSTTLMVRINNPGSTHKKSAKNLPLFPKLSNLNYIQIDERLRKSLFMKKTEVENLAAMSL
jgi:hypothetical protein